MYQKPILSFLGALALFKIGCSNSFIKVHHAITIYGVETIGQPQSSTNGKIVSTRDVKIECEDSKKEPGWTGHVTSTPAEFVIQPDFGKSFPFVQFNEEQFKAGGRILLFKTTEKIRIFSPWHKVAESRGRSSREIRLWKGWA